MADRVGPWMTVGSFPSVGAAARKVIEPEKTIRYPGASDRICGYELSTNASKSAADCSEYCSLSGLGISG
jgi:hypothetical protein